MSKFDNRGCTTLKNSEPWGGFGGGVQLTAVYRCFFELDSGSCTLSSLCNVVKRHYTYCLDM